jgi:isoleucyl-tRNA synthetase
VLNDTYVTADSGTGIVHQAPAFGEDDHRIAREHGVVREDEIPPCPIDESGRFTDEVPEYKGKSVKEADPFIIKDLTKTGRLIVRSDIVHSYPFCWRSGTPLIYRAIPAWFVRVANIKDKLVANNEKTRWVPEHVGEGRFGGWLKNARDWNISRNRYWGTPIPLWASDDMKEVSFVYATLLTSRLSVSVRFSNSRSCQVSPGSLISTVRTLTVSPFLLRKVAAT